MEVILLDKVGKIGGLGDKVNVKAGYGRNYLIPQGKAVPATKENVETFEARRAELEREANERLEAARARAAQLGDLELTIAVKAGEGGKLFGSIGPRDLADVISSAGVEVEKSEVLLPGGPLRQTGEFEIDLRLHAEVGATVTVIVVPEE